jgi:hypothetical protein
MAHPDYPSAKTGIGDDESGEFSGCQADPPGRKLGLAMNDHFASIVHADRMAEYQQQADASRLATTGATRRRSVPLRQRVMTAILVTIALLAALLIRGAI